MSIEFGFAAGDVKSDGHLDEIYKDDLSDLRPGFTAIEDIGLPKYGKTCMIQALGLNMKAQELLNDATGGQFLEFTAGNLNLRYLRLSPRLPQLTALKERLDRIEDEYLRLWLELFVENCEHALNRHGDRAILLIY